MQTPSWWPFFGGIQRQLGDLESKVGQVLAGQAEVKALLLEATQQGDGMLRQLFTKLEKIMSDTARILEQEQAEGAKIDGLVASVAALSGLTDEIFARLSAIPNPSPDVQAVLDLIAANGAKIDAAKASIDATVTKDTPTA